MRTGWWAGRAEATFLRCLPTTPFNLDQASKVCRPIRQNRWHYMASRKTSCKHSFYGLILRKTPFLHDGSATNSDTILFSWARPSSSTLQYGPNPIHSGTLRNSHEMLPNVVTRMFTGNAWTTALIGSSQRESCYLNCNTFGTLRKITTSNPSGRLLVVSALLSEEQTASPAL